MNAKTQRNGACVLLAACLAASAYGQGPGMSPDSGADTGKSGHRGKPASIAPAAATGSLYDVDPVVAYGVEDPDGGPPVARSASFFYVSRPETKKFKKHDLVTIIIHEQSDASTTAKGESTKDQKFDMQVQNFLQMHTDSNLLPTATSVSNTSKLPEIKFSYNNARKNDATQQRQDTVTARVEAEIIDVKPNGTLIVEATKTIRTDKEEQVFRLSGVCRADDVAPDNSILSTQLAELKFSKDTTGEVRDGVRRGWLNSAIDKFIPF